MALKDSADAGLAATVGLEVAEVAFKRVLGPSWARNLAGDGRNQEAVLGPYTALMISKEGWSASTVILQLEVGV